MGICVWFLYIFSFLRILSYLRMYLYAGPFGSSVAPDSALELVSELRAQLEALKEEEQSIHYGLNIFDIEEPASKDILNLEKVPIHCCYSKNVLHSIH